MQQIQLYIQGQQVDLFKDESVTITQSIQNVRDIAKIFTEFSKQFTVPASKTNNKIFRHYYNFEVIDNTFDARSKKDAIVELNYLPYFNGKIQLDSVELRNNKPYAYKITFFGNTVNLKDLLGKDTLNELDLNLYNQEYSPAKVKDLLQADPDIYYNGTVSSVTSNRLNGSFGTEVIAGTQVYNITTNQATTVVSRNATYLTLTDNIFTTVGDSYEVSNHIIAPLLTAQTRLYYDSVQHIQNTGNLFYHTGSGTSHLHGVTWRDLKYSIRMQKIIEAIESKYTTANGYASDISFSTDFFNSSNDRWFDLYMWLHRKSGFVESGATLEKNASFVDGWNNETGAYGFNYISNNYLHKTESGDNTFVECLDFDLKLESSTTDLFDVQIYRNGSIFYEETDIDINSTGGTHIIELDEDATGTFHVVILSTTDIVFTNIQWKVQFEGRIGFNRYTITDRFDTSDVGNYTAFGTNFTFIVDNQIPEMSVLDFLTGVFKTFNLTAFVQTDGAIYVDTLDNFYANKKSQSTPYEISQYVDVNSMTVEPALPFREIKFTFEDTGTYLAKIHNQLFANVWGEERYTQVDDANIMVGSGIYDVESPFGHIKFERLYDQDDNSLSSIQYGWSVGENQSPYIGKPVIFYPESYTLSLDGTGSISISFIDVVNLAGDNFQSHQAVSGSVNMPKNSTGLSSLNFKAEIDEYAGVTYTDSLFDGYYKNYILDVFNPKARLTKIKAYLPLSILLNFTLADQFSINDKTYKINSITTNLQTGESNMELLNVL